MRSSVSTLPWLGKSCTTTCLSHHHTPITYPPAVDTVVQDNINPIEKAERSLLIMATTLHRVPAAALVNAEHVQRLAALTPGLFPQAQLQQ